MKFTPTSSAAPTTLLASRALGATPNVAVPKQIFDTLTPVGPSVEYCIGSTSSSSLSLSCSAGCSTSSWPSPYPRHHDALSRRRPRVTRRHDFPPNEVLTMRCLFDARLADGNRVHAVLGTLASPGACISSAMVRGPEGVVASSAGLE